MNVSTRSVLALAVVAAVACGPSREEERQDKIQKICDAAVGKTVRAVWEELSGDQPLFFQQDCRPDWSSLGSDDACTYDGTTSYCEGGWNYVSNDPNACSANGCYYACIIHVEQTVLEANQATLEAPICAARFVKGQPNPVISPY